VLPWFGSRGEALITRMLQIHDANLFFTPSKCRPAQTGTY